MRNRRLWWGGLAVLVLLAVVLGLMFQRASDSPQHPEETVVSRAGAGAARKASAPRTRPDVPREPLRLMPAARVVESDARYGAFAGRVLSASTGEGVPGAELTFAPEGGGATSIRTGPGGTFHFSPTEAGRWQLASVIAEGFLPFGPEWGRSPVWLTATPGRQVEGVVVALTPEVTIRGRVEDEDGKPIAGAQVEVITDAESGTSLFPAEATQLVSDADGSFLLRAPEETQVEARHPGFLPALATVTPEVVLSRKLVLSLAKAAGDAGTAVGVQAIAGVVVDDEGAPLAEVRVTVSSADNAWPARYGTGGTALTDPAGRFRVEGLEEGTWDVTAQKEGRATVELTDVRSGSEDLRLTLREATAEEGAVLEGVVREQRGPPVPSFTLSVDRREGPLRRTAFETLMVVDAGGHYRVTGLTPGSYAVQVAAAGLAPTESLLEVRPGEKGPLRVDFQLSPGARLTGTVIDAETKQPLRGARLTVEGMGAQGELAVRFDALSDAAGAFEIDGLAEGEVSLHAMAGGHHSRIIGGIVARAGVPASLRIELRPTEEDEDPRLELTGIGAVLAAREDALVVGQVVAGGGAAEAGLAPGDAVLRIDGQPVVDLGFAQAVQRIRGPENSLVMLGVRKAGQEATTDVPVTRRRLEL